MAAELTKQNTELIERCLQGHRGSTRIPPPILFVESYFRWLSHWLEHGKLPDDPAIERAPSPRRMSRTNGLRPSVGE
jgi:hypothetical protein